MQVICWLVSERKSLPPPAGVRAHAGASSSFTVGRIDVAAVLDPLGARLSARNDLSFSYCTRTSPRIKRWNFVSLLLPAFTSLILLSQMSVQRLNIRYFLIISVALLGAILLFLKFGRTSPSPFQRSANGPLSFGGDSLQDVFNQTLGVSTINIYFIVASSRL